MNSKLQNQGQRDSSTRVPGVDIGIAFESLVLLGVGSQIDFELSR